MVNEERAVEKVPALAMDDLATQVATKHATEMAMHEFASHWGRDGLKPYHRYSFAGGTDATQENVSAADNTWSNNMDLLKQDTSYLHVRLYQEKPPNDGHRKNILIPTHNRLGVGLARAKALEGESSPPLCVAQEFVDVFGKYDELPKTARAGQSITVAGRVDAPVEFRGVGIALGPLPDELYASDLNSTSTYLMPVPYATYFPKGFVTPKEVKLENGRFSIELKLDRGAGRYAVSVWGRFPSSENNELAMVSLRTILVR